MVTSRRALDAALVHDDLTTHEDHFCANAAAGPRAPTSCNPFVRGWYGTRKSVVSVVSKACRFEALFAAGGHPAA